MIYIYMYIYICVCVCVCVCVCARMCVCVCVCEFSTLNLNYLRTNFCGHSSNQFSQDVFLLNAAVVCVQNVLMGILEVSDKKNILASFENSLQRIYRPTLKAMSSWGELDKSPTGKQIIRGFADYFDTFLMTMNGRISNLRQYF